MDPYVRYYLQKLITEKEYHIFCKLKYNETFTLTIKDISTNADVSATEAFRRYCHKVHNIWDLRNKYTASNPALKESNVKKLQATHDKQIKDYQDALEWERIVRIVEARYRNADLNQRIAPGVVSYDHVQYVE